MKKTSSHRMRRRRVEMGTLTWAAKGLRLEMGARINCQ
jgi:hypothetical protein